MDMKDAGASLDALVASFNARVVELQELVIARNMYPSTSISDLSAIDSTLKTIESQVQSIKDRLQEERDAIPKAKKLLEQSLQQQKKIQHMLTHMPSRMHENTSFACDTPIRLAPETPGYEFQPVSTSSMMMEERSMAPKLTLEKKSRSSAPRWYVTAMELDSLSSYMRGRLTLEKVNIAINEMASYAEATSFLITNPKKKLSEDAWEKALEIRDIAMSEAVKGKFFFLESDIRGPGLKLDNTGKATLTVLRHLGRIQEVRNGHHRVIALLKPPNPA